jgi:hypothetical protein
VQPLSLWQSSEYYTTRVCVFVALGIQHAMRKRDIFISDLPRCTIFFHIFSWTVRVSKKLLNIVRVFWFSLQPMSEAFLILRRSERDVIKMYNFLRVKYPYSFSDFNEILIFSTYFRQILRCKISWKSVQWEQSCSIRTDRRTEMKKLIIFLQFCEGA